MVAASSRFSCMRATSLCFAGEKMADPLGLSELRELLWVETLGLMLGRNLGGEEGMGKSFFPYPA